MAAATTAALTLLLAQLAAATSIAGQMKLLL
jgi:hypothetical protein